MSFVNVDFEDVWPVLVNPGYLLDGNEDALHNLGVNLVLAGALAFAALAAFQAGIEMGMELAVEQMRQGAMRQAMKQRQDILVPSRQLILPGSKEWKP